MSDSFWIDEDVRYSYSDLITDLNSINEVKSYIKSSSGYWIFKMIVHSLIHQYPITLLDSDFSDDELKNYGYSLDIINHSEKVKPIITKSFDDILNRMEKSTDWKISLLTSGTTGIPKRITHNFYSISKAVKISDEHQKDVWGFAYNPTHIAGIQVFFQGFMNKNTLVNLFELSPKKIHAVIESEAISHISATPTFYRLIMDDKQTHRHVKQISSGGEKLSSELKFKLTQSFPNAKIKNIYASTEAGSLLASEGEYFRIPERYASLIKIINNEIVLNESILGESQNFLLHDGWYFTGDIIEFKDKDTALFKFVHRKNQMINVGGYKVNPEEVEDAMLRIPQIESVRVFGKQNKLLGNILCAEVVANNITEKEIRSKLILQEYKIPRIIHFTDKISITRTGKVKR